MTRLHLHRTRSRLELVDAVRDVDNPSLFIHDLHVPKHRAFEPVAFIYPVICQCLYHAFVPVYLLSCECYGHVLYYYCGRACLVVVVMRFFCAMFA